MICNRINGTSDHIRAHHHATTTAKGCIIHTAMTVQRMVTNVHCIETPACGSKGFARQRQP
jgi:hypothetical protein